MKTCLTILRTLPLVTRNISISINWRSTSLYSTGSGRKRFYKDVAVTRDDGLCEITLDGKKLKTPKGSVLQLDSYPLALAVATEWITQDKWIRFSNMHLTALSFTSQDNPMKLTKESLSKAIIDYLDTDTVCYRSSELPDLTVIENSRWNPVIEWFMNHYNVDVTITDLVTEKTIPEPTKEAILKSLLSFKLRSLFGLQFMTENLKSVILSHALLGRNVSVEEAVSLSRLETEYQVAKWGNVEWAHDVDVVQTRSRVAAGLLFVTLNENMIPDRKEVKKN